METIGFTSKHLICFMEVLNTYTQQHNEQKTNFEESINFIIEIKIPFIAYSY